MPAAASVLLSFIFAAKRQAADGIRESIAATFEVRVRPRPCENSHVELARRKFVSITFNRKRTALAVIVEEGTREKTILRVLCSRTFSHSLDPKPTSSFF